MRVTTMGETLNRMGWLIVVILIAAITAIHYATPIHFAETHTVFRRLYYFPVVLGAFLWGIRGGLGVAATCILAYAPHAFFMPHHLDPASTIDKILEFIMFLSVGTVVGLLVGRERRAKAEQAREATERKAAESESQQLQTLVHLSRGLAHEIRNPLGGIQGAIEIMAEEIPLTSPRREMVDVALREVARLDVVVGEFLDVAKPHPTSPEVFALGPVVDHVVALLRTEAENAGLHFENRVGNNHVAVGDARQITQILVNLVRNAIQATPRGGHVSVGLTANDKQKLVQIEVEDSGCGIPPQIRTSLFEPYVTGRHGGTGLGLFVSSLLSRQNGGVLTYRDRPEGGTIFSLIVRSGKESPGPEPLPHRGA